MKLTDLLKTTPETLASEQHKALKCHVVERLETVLQAIRDENYKYIGKLTSNSPAGDGYGNDNNFIEFGFDSSASMDISEAVDLLMSLKTISENKPKNKK